MREQEKSRELDHACDEIITSLNRRLRQPLNQGVGAFDYIRRLKFKSDQDRGLVAAELRKLMRGFDQILLSETQAAELVQAFARVKREVTALAKGEKQD